MKKLTLAVLMIAACWFAAAAAHGAELNVPEQVTAGDDLNVSTSGSGSATMYLAGPATALKREVRLGGDVKISGEELHAAGRYTLVIGSGSASFTVLPAKTTRLSFLALPSRLPVALNSAISGVVYPFDAFHNLVVQPQTVNFNLSVADAKAVSRPVKTSNGVAWLQLDSTRKAGPAQFVASIGDVEERRVIEQTPSDPCNLRMKIQRNERGLLVETDPIRDCSGNPVPDGTIVTFTETSPQGKSSVDARIKRGIARAELPLVQGAVISVASGVVLGNEVRVGGGE